MAKKDANCSFCGANRNSVKMLIAGVSGHICENCAVQASTIVKEEFNIEKSNDNSTKNKKTKLR